MHPVRLRILRTLAGHRMAAKEIAHQLPYIPQTTLYRQLSLLVEGGIVQVVEERRVRGTVERTYAMAQGESTLTGEGLANASRQEHFGYFAMFVSELLAEFGRYLERPRVDLAADGVGYRQAVLHLDDQEFAALQRGLASVLQPLLGNEPSPRRTPRLLTTVLLPLSAQSEEAQQ